jgi:hypothetical protein
MVLSRSRRGRSFPSRMHGIVNTIDGVALVADNYRDDTARVEVVAVLQMRTICTPYSRETKRAGVLSQRTVRTPQLSLRTVMMRASPCKQSGPSQQLET